MCALLSVFFVLVLFLRCHTHSLHTSHDSRCPSVCLTSSMHEVSFSSDFLDLFITFIFLLSFLINLKQFLATLQLPRGLSSKISCATSSRRWGQLTSPSPTHRSLIFLLAVFMRQSTVASGEFLAFLARVVHTWKFEALFRRGVVSGSPVSRVWVLLVEYWYWIFRKMLPFFGAQCLARQ